MPTAVTVVPQLQAVTMATQEYTYSG